MSRISTFSGPLFVLALISSPQEFPNVSSLPGPLDAKVIEVVDGDTIKVAIQIWLDQRLYTSIRVKGIDTPETFGQCEEEKEKAAGAKQFLKNLLSPGTTIQLTAISRDKYGGRYVANTSFKGGQISHKMIGEGFALPYSGRGKKPDWCKILKGEK